MVIFSKFSLMLLVILNLSLQSGHGISPLTIVSWVLPFLCEGNCYVNNIPYAKPENSIQHKTNGTFSENDLTLENLGFHVPQNQPNHAISHHMQITEFSRNRPRQR